jgi:hypothetical protein
MSLLERIFTEPAPIRKAIQMVVRRLGIGSYRFRLAIGGVPRPNYGYLVYQAAQLAHRLGEPRVSVVEFGVAAGAGLLALEWHAEQVEKLFPVKIEVYGFDTGEGLPEPVDYRDLPYHWKQGFFKMDVPLLQSRLKRAKLILGNISETSKSFFATHSPAPIGAVSHDFDFYSSTAVALRLFETEPRFVLPRVFCYFDDTIGDEVELYGDYTGERLAIADFNAAHDSIKLSVPYYLTARAGAPLWHHQIWIAHFLRHPKYNQFVSAENQHLSI